MWKTKYLCEVNEFDLIQKNELNSLNIFQNASKGLGLVNLGEQ